jgi:predicted Zn-dependent protease
MNGPRSLFAAARASHLTRDQAQALTTRILAFSSADEMRVNLSSGASANTRFAVNQISTAGDSTNVSVTVRAIFGKQAGSATTNRLDDESLRAVVRRAEALARLAPEDPQMMPELGPQQYLDGGGYANATAELDPMGRAAAVQSITEPAAVAGLVSTGYLEANAGSTAVATSRGLFAWREQTSTVLTTTVRTPDGTGSGWAGATHHDWTRLNPAALGATAIDKARQSANPVAVEPGRYTVVLEPTAVGNLVQLISRAASARSADEGRSFFSKPGGGTKMGMKVVDERVTLLSDPLDPEAYGQTFGGDGLPTKKMTWIENGLVKNLSYDRFWAQKQGVEPSGFPGTLRMMGGNTSVEEMIASTERGLLVTRFWYIRPVDPRTILYTGLTRDGTFLIENGKVTRAVKNLRWNESPIFMLNNIEAMGAPVRVSASESGGPGQAIVVPPLKVRDFTFTSLSDAV